MLFSSFTKLPIEIQAIIREFSFLCNTSFPSPSYQSEIESLNSPENAAGLHSSDYEPSYNALR